MTTESFLQYVFVRFRFEGFHCWPDAPPEVAFLASRHRHVFHVEARARVTHDDRDREFILAKRELEAWCLARSTYEIEHGPNDTTNWSCERWCLELLKEFPWLVEVSVSEDGENGATVKAVTR